MATKQHWMDGIADEIRQRAHDMVDHVAGGIVDVAPFGGQKPDQPQEPSLEQFLQAAPDQRQAYLSQLGPEFGNVVGKLMSQANERFGPIAASKLAPVFTMGQMAGTVADMSAQGQQPELGVTAAQADLADLLGVDPFAQ